MGVGESSPTPLTPATRKPAITEPREVEVKRGAPMGVYSQPVVICNDLYVLGEFPWMDNAITEFFIYKMIFYSYF